VGHAAATHGGPPVTNIRNTSSPALEELAEAGQLLSRAVQRFAESAPEPRPSKKDVVWFALNDDRPLTAFAGI
jgi:hypothetical protein